MNFVHLHVHTEYSLLDGACRIGNLLDAVKENGQNAVAITDHGVMYGAVNFYKEAVKRGIKPIIGCEVYVAPRTRFDKIKALDGEYNHLVLLCKNEVGYRNLIKLVSAGFIDGFYSKPRIDKELLAENHEGLIALSACLAGEIPSLILKGQFDRAEKTALWFDNVFGRGNYYLELQDHGIDEQHRVNPDIIRISKKTGIPLVATNDVHYVGADDWKMQKVLTCIQTGKKLTDTDILEFKTHEFYLKSTEEMYSLFEYEKSALENTQKVADMCDFNFDFGHLKLPFFDIGDRDHTEFFREKCYEGLYKNYGQNPDKSVVDRLEYELDTIIKMGYIDYYLIVQDFVNYAKSRGIPVGPGRGSGAGSLAAYCIGITGIDPIRYNLLFERFLNPERVSMPDFDIDFCYIRRPEVIEYVIGKYGSDRVAQIVTFGTLAARAAVRDVGRTMDMPYALCDRISKLIPASMDMTIEKAIGISKELRELIASDPKITELIEIAKSIEGMPRNASTHAAGVVITDKPVDCYVPLALNGDMVVTQYTMTALEELGLLKMDFLGLRNLTVISDAEKVIKKRVPDFDIEKIPLDDKPTMQMLAKGNTVGVFQYESEGVKNVLRQLCPERIEDLIAVVSLYRPGPMDSIPKYVHNRHHPNEIKYDTPLLKDILDVTYGCMVYQEQVMQVFRNLAGYSLGRADIVRRAMSKKKHDVMEKERKAFVYGEIAPDGTNICDGAVNRGVPEDVAQSIFDQMTAFSSYAFNKSHAAAYAVVAYRTAYLKCHYSAEYMAALLTSVLDNAGKVYEYTAECNRLGIEILPPSVNYSPAEFCVEGEKSVRFGLLAVKNLGRGLIDKLVKEREANGKYKSYYDFCIRNAGREMNRRALEGLIESGALDSLADSRRQMLLNIDAVLSATESHRRFSAGGQMDLFGTTGQEDNTFVMPPCEEFSESEKLRMEKEVTGLYLSGHPMREYENTVRALKTPTLSKITSGAYNDGDYVTVAVLLSSIKVKTTKSNRRIGTLSLEDQSGAVDGVAFDGFLDKYSAVLHDGTVIKLSGKISEREDRPTEIICDRAEILQKSTATDVKTPLPDKIYLQTENTDEAFAKIKSMLSGKCGGDAIPLYVFRKSDRKTFEAPKDCWIPALQLESKILQLKSAFGSENVKTVCKKG